MNVNDKVLINSKDWHNGKIGTVKKFSDKVLDNVGLELEGYSKIVWFFKSDLTKIN